MGQYYKAVVLYDDGKEVFLHSPSLYGNGFKLMEHSYVGNRFVDSVMTRIYHNKARVCWCGDYSDSMNDIEYDNLGDGFVNGRDEYINIVFRHAWERNSPSEPFVGAFCSAPYDDDEILGFDCKRNGVFLVNHTKRQYVDLAEYCKNNVVHIDAWNVDECISPLPLLTVLGCGDYCGDSTYVGIWALDVLSVEDERPEDYCKVSVWFKEDRLM